MTAWLSTLIALIAALPFGPAQDEAPPRCNKCKQEGLLPCGEHRGLDLSREHEVLYCSFLADCETCGGTGFVDCPKCESPVPEGRNAKKLAAIAKRGEKLKELDDALGRTLRKGETEHFVLVWEIDELKVKKKRVKDHELLHLYLGRMEELYDAYTETFGVADSEFREKSRLFVWYFMQDHHTAAKVFCGNSADKGVKLMGGNIAYSVAGTKRFFRDDEALHRNLVHSTSHLLFSHQRPSQWIGQIKGGWADAGVAHWFEDKFFGICDNYCYQEVNTQANFKGGKWKPAVKKLVSSGDASPVAQVMRKNTTVLTPAEHALSFSYVDFLIATDGEKADKLFRRLRGKIAARDAMKEAFGWNLLEFEAAWKEWVLATYPSR